MGGKKWLFQKKKSLTDGQAERERERDRNITHIPQTHDVISLP
jgi:hypothetical protein